MKKYQLSHLISLQNSIHFYTTLRLRRGQDVSQLILLCRSLKHLMLLFITVIRIFFFKSHLLFQSPTSYCQLYIPGTEKHPLKPLKCWIIILWLMWLTLIRSIPASQAATL